ncbi:hypothetical protein A9995_11190 [Erythrobacter sp. QSSC1-22B]|uniref:glycine zipper 2TM domain-containing protein n=1 Tax=Erythrobacter sp. QSSC1-22B TaxID=1860125 RepID=UPI000805FF28|nr:glycine zipper 2TM domain-containing protein [Erythrobacter sp. QSSC1-22B]OBX18526.1 hypothetical protein A9995_11190 [Erythrobacter sp. QSSC1-22B]
MAKSFTLAGMALAATGLALSAPAVAAPAAHSSAAPAGASLVPSFATPHVFHEQTSQMQRDRRDRRYQKRGRNQSRDNYERYSSNYDQPIRNNTRIWRGDDGRAYCKKDDGTTGLLIGAGVGALIGNEVAGRGDRTLGAILGAAGGALLGREIDRSSTRCR